MINILLVGIGAAIGSVFRFLLLEFQKRYIKVSFPIITLLINIVGSFSLGYLTPLTINPQWHLFFGSGMIGGFTTFSTFITEVFMTKQTNNKKALIYTGVMLFLGLFFCFLGLYLGNRN